MRKLGYLGPRGTFSHTAALCWARDHGYAPVCCASLDAIFEQVAGGRLAAGLVPVENSLGGPVGETLDLLSTAQSVYITGEQMLPVRQHLLARPGMALSAIEKVYSHPQALAQCRKFIKNNMPGATVVETVSTAAAALTVTGSGALWAAVGSESAAHAYGLEILKQNIHDNPGNVTRFLVLGKERAFPAGPAKTSLVLSVKDRPGALYRILREFALRQVNLTRIESRPAGHKLGDYIFFIDLAGREDEPKVIDALRSVKENTLWMKILGCYGAAVENKAPGAAITGGPDNLAFLRHEIDLVDSEILHLLAMRQSMVDRVAALKKCRRPVVDHEREREIICRARETARQNKLDPEMVENIYRLILRASVHRQEQLLAAFP